MDPDGNDPESFFVKLRNLYNLRQAVDAIVLGVRDTGSQFILSEQLVRTLHRTCMVNLLPDAGEYRKKPVGLSGGGHIPPNWTEVEALMKSFCEFVNQKWANKDLVWLSSFCLWRLNWIHPFSNGNGRTARELSYLVLNAKYGGLLPSKNSIIEQIMANKRPFQDALGYADLHYKATNNFDICLTQMCSYMQLLLTNQLRANF